MAERRLNIRLGILGEGAVSNSLKSIKKQFEGLDTITKAFSGKGAFGALVDGMRIAANWAEKIREQVEKISVGTQTWQASIAQISRDLPVIGDTMRFLDAVTGRVSPDERLRRAMEARQLGRQNRDELKNLIGLSDRAFTGDALKRRQLNMAFLARDSGIQDRIADLELRLATEVNALSRTIIQDTLKLLQEQLKEVRKQVEADIANVGRKPIIANLMKSRRADLQDLLTSIGLAGASGIEGASPLTNLLFPKRRPPISPSLPISRIAELFEGSASSFIAREQSAIEEARVAAEERTAEKQQEAAERQKQAAEVMKNASVGFLESMRAFGEIVGATRPIGG